MRPFLVFPIVYVLVCINYAVIISDLRHDYCACSVYGYVDGRLVLTEIGEPLLFLTRADADRYVEDEGGLRRVHEDDLVP